MGANPSAITEAELAVLECLWELGRCVKRDVVNRLYPAGSTSDFATVQKLLDRLERKGFVSRDRTSVTHAYTPTLDRDEYAAREVQAIAERITKGSLVPIVMNLVEGRFLSKKDRDRLRAVLDESDEPKRRKRS